MDLLLAASSAAQSSTSRSSAATNSVQVLQSISENGNDCEEAEYDDEDEDEDDDDNDSNDDCSVEEEYNEAVIAACNNTDVDDINSLIIAEHKKQNCR